MKLGLDQGGTLEVPPGPAPAGWFTGAPTPGELGPAIVVGHISYNGVDGVFHDLHTLEVRRQDRGQAAGRRRRNLSRDQRQVLRQDQIPSELVYGNVDYAGLRLITCDDYNPKTGSYQSNLVVFATLI